MSRRSKRDRDGEFTDFASVVAPRLFRSALLMCGDWQLAEDLVQTALAKLYVAWPKVSRADNPDAYAQATLTKTFLSHRRVRRNAEMPIELSVDDGAPADEPALRLDLLDLLRRLSPIDRAVVVLRYWEDRSVDATAAVLGMTPAAVRTRASRALKTLRDDLHETTDGQR